MKMVADEHGLDVSEHLESAGPVPVRTVAAPVAGFAFPPLYSLWSYIFLVLSFIPCCFDSLLIPNSYVHTQKKQKKKNTRMICYPVWKHCKIPDSYFFYKWKEVIVPFYIFYELYNNE